MFAFTINFIRDLLFDSSGPPPRMFPGPPRSTAPPGVLPSVSGPPRMMSRPPHALPAGPPTVMSRAGAMPPHTMMSTRPPAHLMPQFQQVMYLYIRYRH